jgi:hypothetical protein
VNSELFSELKKSKKLKLALSNRDDKRVLEWDEFKSSGTMAKSTAVRLGQKVWTLDLKQLAFPVQNGPVEKPRPIGRVSERSTKPTETDLYF